jgi:hypothetical protein
VRGEAQHLGVGRAPKRSTLSYANEHRPWDLYQTVFYQLLDKCRVAAHGRRPFRFKHRLYSFDSTTIDLCLSLFNWAHYMRTKGAIKLHLLLDHEGYLPVFAHLTDGKAGDTECRSSAEFARRQHDCRRSRLSQLRTVRSLDGSRRVVRHARPNAT